MKRGLVHSLLAARTSHIVRCDRLDHAMHARPEQLESAYARLALTVDISQQTAIFREVAGRHRDRCKGLLS